MREAGVGMRWLLRRIGLVELDGVAAVAQLAAVGAEEGHGVRNLVLCSERCCLCWIGNRVEIHEQQVALGAQRRVRREGVAQAAGHFPGIGGRGGIKERLGRGGEIA